ncbi:L,D-transpeptidase family protein [Sphingomonas abietis]|uniref:L,D-transpeptidase family protein n=1 Tax=Sphingomonas abietis TaxID=3012344 RepID=A0ABY7NTL2_9SPHN|nr:L,D-transpeptidase family protein [Sphingomonas abietis]WBO23998.1 L,D-transpeptidase family protein [Sphingomonas abietis]
MKPVSRRAVSAALLSPALLAAAPQPIPTLAPPPPVAAPVTAVTPPAAIAIPRLSAAQLDQLRTMLDDAAANGIAADGQTSAAPASADQDAIVRAALDYASALHHGRLADADFIGNWGLKPAAYDPRASFIAAVQADTLAAWIASLPPPWSGYDTLRKALTSYRSIEQSGGWPTVPNATGLVPGATGDAVALLRRRLAIEDSALPKGPARYDDDLSAAVQRAQRRYGLEPTGTIGAATLAALNVSAHDRVRQIEANMERWRWLPAELPQHRVQVNIAAAVLTMFDADKPVMSMRAVTGRPGDETPMLSSMIHSIVLNPPWNVPTSIATKELWPKERAHPGYLKAHGFRVIGTGSGARLQQQAGSKSALGRVKFDFENSYGVYLHDTPSQSTFGRYSRLASHGCVRLAHPVELAKAMLDTTPDWGPDAVDAALAKGDTVRARLDMPVAVYLLYWTAYANADGKVTFLADPYGWDGQLADRLATSANRAKTMTAAQ